MAYRITKRNITRPCGQTRNLTNHYKHKTPAQAFTPPADEKEMGHNLDICVLRRLRLRQGQMQGFLGLKVGGCLNLQIWDLNRAHETERTVFPILLVFSMCRRKL